MKLSTYECDVCSVLHHKEKNGWFVISPPKSATDGLVIEHWAAWEEWSDGDDGEKHVCSLDCAFKIIGKIMGGSDAGK